MRKSWLAAATGAAALSLLAAPALAGATYDRATGGGQILVSSDGGAGDTIAFSAQNTADGARGQVQYVDRTGGTGVGQTVYHGTVTCLTVSGNAAKLGGYWTDDAGAFTMIVTDNGEGAAANNDTITLDRDVSTPDCSRQQNDDSGAVDLARGNAQVYDAP